MERFSTPSLMVDAPRRSYDRQGMYPCWDNQDRTSSPLSDDHNYFSAPTSPRAWQNLVQNDNLDLSSVPDSRFEVDGNGRDKRDHEEEFEFEFISPVSELDEPPLSPTLIFNSSSWMLLRQPPPPLLKPPPHLRRPHSLSVQEASPALEKSHVLEEEDGDAATQQQEKPSIKAKNWRLKDFLNQNNGEKKKWPPIPHSWPHGRHQGSMSSSSSSPSSSVATGKKVMNGTAMRMRTSSPPSFPLPLPPSPSTPISSLPSSTRKSSTTASPHETLYRSKRAQLRSRQKKMALPYRPGFLGCLRFASKCYISIAEFSRGLLPVT